MVVFGPHLESSWSSVPSPLCVESLLFSVEAKLPHRPNWFLFKLDTHQRLNRLTSSIWLNTANNSLQEKMCPPASKISQRTSKLLRSTMPSKIVFTIWSWINSLTCLRMRWWILSLNSTSWLNLSPLTCLSCKFRTLGIGARPTNFPKFKINSAARLPGLSHLLKPLKLLSQLAETLLLKIPVSQSNIWSIAIEPKLAASEDGPLAPGNSSRTLASWPLKPTPISNTLESRDSASLSRTNLRSENLTKISEADNMWPLRSISSSSSSKFSQSQLPLTPLHALDSTKVASCLIMTVPAIQPPLMKSHLMRS